MNLNFAIALEATRVVTTETQKIDAISVANEVIGYVCINKSENATAFNASGQIADMHCPICALETLFAWHTGIDTSAINVASAANPASLIMSAIISAAAKH